MSHFENDSSAIYCVLHRIRHWVISYNDIMRHVSKLLKMHFDTISFLLLLVSVTVSSATCEMFYNLSL